MTIFERPDRCCPKCESNGYLFRGRKNGEGPEGPFIETKYRCRSCSHDWRERILTPQVKTPAGESAGR